MQAHIMASIMQRAETGVDYSPREGATCPLCGTPRLPVVCTKAWVGTTRIRYHRCGNPQCLLHSLGKQIKSVEVG